jgi:protein-ribulosamine 3-kinase
MTHWPDISAAIAAATSESFTVEACHAVGGGCINRAHRVEGGGRRYFVKLNDAKAIEMFATEAEALQALHASDAVRVPIPICWGTTERSAYLVLEYLELAGDTASSAETLGRQLAHLHRHTGKLYGWHRDNTIGSTPQINTPSNDWLHFWREQRLTYQLRLAGRHGFVGALQRKGERLLDAVGLVLAGHNPPPSLLHGDLWSGNYAVLRDGQPVIFDPASYFGDRETDLAMTELFGGFPPRFYSAYREHYPLDDGYRLRKTLYNLYHVLNHVNLFGGGYASQAEHMIDTLLSEIR